ncbi:MAG: hypothetical protein KDC43_15545 [Saprospiraceae bacterium]|nr:hypothetical protein [Saprospiraceae bacterium]MCB0625288.1 hypothetical protein [Saprospiraceae bacterium]MCB0676316.1 hypothetical protein [Saprospiraceae bacterium]MCB0680235.1 hypothetical protein [Saprospiraceae bacterium]
MNAPISDRSSDNSTFQLGEWMDELKFYELELKSCELTLEALVETNPTADGTLWKQVEHFQNQFILQGSNLHTLKWDVRRNLPVLESEAWPLQFGSLVSQMQTMRRIFFELLADFDRFFKNWL